MVSELRRIKVDPTSVNVLNLLLQDKRSPNTRRAYQKDLRDFFLFVSESDATPELVDEFLQLCQGEAVMLTLQYKAHLMQRGLTEATVNRRIASIKSLVKYGRKLGRCHYSLEDVQAEKVEGYRDTTGVSAEMYRKILEGCDRVTPKGIRDYAILRLLWDNALRRGELVKINLEDFDPVEQKIRIYGKGKGRQGIFMDLSDRSVEAIQHWLAVRHGSLKPSAPLFTSFMPARKGDQLSGNAIGFLVRDYAIKAGIKKPFSPHRIRHSSITAALDATDGDIRSVLNLSRNTPSVLFRYDDNRRRSQKRVTDLISALV